ncbi:MAG TPA: hypothetical protein VFW10_10390 [Steroidobacteraceae bacterium]|nr:hypothetical protein [Steroidobacteraceae bacterium]
MKHLNGEQLRELSLLRDRAIAFIEFLRDRGLGDEGASEMTAAVSNSYERRDLRALRTARADLDSWLRELPAHEQELAKAALSRVGADFEADRRHELLRIRVIEAEGRIVSDDDYRLVKERVEEIAEDPASHSELAVLTLLLRAYNP